MLAAGALERVLLQCGAPGPMGGGLVTASRALEALALCFLLEIHG